MAVTLTARGWQLYSSMEGAEAAASALNEELNKLIKQAKHDIIEGDMDSTVVAKRVQREMKPIMEKFMDFGACDTEPEWALVDAINKELKTNIGRW